MALSILTEVVTINILVKLQPLVEVNRLVRRPVLLLPDEQDELEEARKTSKKIKLVSCSFLKRNHGLWKIKMRPYLQKKKKKKKKKKKTLIKKKKKKKKKK